MSVAVLMNADSPQGRLVDPERPQLLLTDRAATRGDGVFETALFRRGALRAGAAHLQRLQGSAALLGLLTPPVATWEAAISLALGELAAASGVALDALEATVKLVTSRGPEHGSETSWVFVEALDRTKHVSRGPENGLRVLLLDRGYDAGAAERAPWLLAGAKTLSYAVNMAALRWAQQHGADDAIFTTSDGRLLEGPTSSLLIARRKGSTVRLVTPELETGILAGTTQAAAFEAAREMGWELGYGPLTPADLDGADGVWLVSSIRLAAAVTSIDGVPVPCDPELHRLLTEGLDARL